MPMSAIWMMLAARAAASRPDMVIAILYHGLFLEILNSGRG